MKPMLAQPMPSDSLPDLAQDESLNFQQKVDGERMMVVVEDKVVRLLNRRGEPSIRSLSQSQLEIFQRLPIGTWILDGELVGPTLWLFDLPSSPIDKSATFKDRYLVLETLVRIWAPNGDADIQLLPVAWEIEDKLKLAKAVYEGGGEGIIVRENDGQYYPGERRPGLWKCKFTKEVDCVAVELGRDGKSNIVLGLYSNGELIHVGEVNALVGDGPSVQVGEVITVRYLYATPDNRIYQPNVPRRRVDKQPEECVIEQLNYSDKAVLTKW